MKFPDLCGLPWWLNRLWQLKCGREWRRFTRALEQPEQTQRDLLLSMLQANTETDFGRKYQFHSIRSVDDFRDRVPLMTYDQYAPYIEQIAAGSRTVLTAEPVELMEPTSGTGSEPKLIPYPRSLHRQFQRMIDVWIFDLFSRRPRLKSGRAYWSISPSLGPPQRTAGGIPVGFSDDTEYLGGLEKKLMLRLLAVPPEVSRIHDLEQFQRVTLLRLIATEDLALISIWNPTFLTRLLELLPENRERICRALRAGSVRPLTDSDECESSFLAQPRRADLLQSLSRANAAPAEEFRELWPKLGLISCWADAAAAPYARQLARLFPGVEQQPKGLLATEGCVTVPLVDRAGAVLAIRSHFFEFEILDENEQPRANPECVLSHQLETGSRYAVVLTTGGGFYRYRLNDVVEVVGWERQVPLLRFCGRAAWGSDLVGEKLSESHVAGVLEDVFRRFDLDVSFVLMVPIADPPHYRVYLRIAPAGAVDLRRIGEAIQSELAANPYYAQAMALHQLAPLELCRIEPESILWPGLTSVASAKQKLGDAKPRIMGSQQDCTELESLIVERLSLQS